MTIKLGKQYPIRPTEEFKKDFTLAYNKFKFGYVERFTEGIPYPYRIIARIGDSVIDTIFTLKRNEFEYVNVKPINKEDWL